MGNLGPHLHQLGQLGYLTTPDPKVQTSGCSISDRGSQYAAGNYQKLLKANGIVPSMSRKGNCWDNP